MGSAGAAAAALSTMFQEASEEDDLGPDLVPPFEPTRGLPELFQQAERARHGPVTDREGALADLRRNFPGIAGVVIVRDSEESESIQTPR